MTTVDTHFPRTQQADARSEVVAPEVRATLRQIQTGQTLAVLELEEIITKTKRWAREGRLNRGLRLSLPYFDDRAAEMRWRDIDVIPGGMILFVPAFVVLAVHREAQATAGDRGLTESTRAHLMALLRALQQAFGPVPEQFQI